MIPQCEWKDCPGGAHENAYIDNCSICAPRWGRIPICPGCKEPLTVGRGANPTTGQCREIGCDRIGGTFSVR